jgi:peptide/nickel transport system permease protein
VRVLRFVGLRLLQLVPVFVGITAVSFLLIHLIPGDPARTMLGPKAPASSVAKFRAEHHLDDALLSQYLSFLNHLVRGNLGTSLHYGVSNSSLIGQRVPVTLLLLVMASLFALVISVPLALWAASHQGHWQDGTVRFGMVLGLGVPPFWLGVVLLMVLALRTGWFPVGGYGDTYPEHLWSMVLPAFTIAVGLAPVLTRSLRSEITKALNSDYVLSARAKGLKPRRVLVHHALLNAVGPTATVLVINLGALVGGTVVIESVFSLPGLGQLLVQSIHNRDFSVVQGLTIVFALAVVLLNLANDVFQAALDRRIALGS